MPLPPPPSLRPFAVIFPPLYFCSAIASDTNSGRLPYVPYADLFAQFGAVPEERGFRIYNFVIQEKTH